MFKLVAAIAASTAVAAAPQAHHRHFAHHRECYTDRCARKADKTWNRHREEARRRWLRKHPPTATAVLTWYSTEGCDSSGGGGSTAMGTVPRFGEVANSVLAFGTKIEVSPPIMGLRIFRVEDRFGSTLAANRFDVWVHCGTGGSVPATVRYRIVR